MDDDAGLHNEKDEVQRYLEQAYLFEEDGKFEEALLQCEKVIEMTPTLAEAHNLRGLILEGLDRPKDAAKAYREAIRLDPNYQDAADNLAELELELKTGYHLETEPREWGPFKSGGLRAKVVIGFLALGITLNLVAILAISFEINLLLKAMEGQVITEQEVTANDDRLQMVGSVQRVVFFITAILYLMWVYRAYQNLPPLGVKGLKYSPGGAVVSFLIPILNLFRPYQIVKETWKASDPRTDTSTDPTIWQTVTPSIILGLWWFFWITSNGFIGVVRVIYRQAENLGEFLIADWLAIASQVLFLIAATCAIIVVKTINGMQEKKHNLITPN